MKKNFNQKLNEFIFIDYISLYNIQNKSYNISKLWQYAKELRNKCKKEYKG